MWEDLKAFFDTVMSHDTGSQNVITSLLLFLILITLRTVLVHVIKRKSEILDKDQRRWINRINNTTTIFIFLGLAFIWAPQLQTFALSLTAVAVAIVLITKELLMCLTGGFLRASSKPFEVGDWITVDDLSGEVMSISATMTLLEKVDVENGSYEHTGETIQIPNSRFLTAHVENLNFTKKYIYHVFNITVQFKDFDPQALAIQLSDIIKDEVETYTKDALNFNKMIERRTGVDFAEIEPSCVLKTTDLGHYKFHIRIFVPTAFASKTEDRITSRFLKECHDFRQTLIEREGLPAQE